MPRKKLPRALKTCERDGCDNQFVYSVGAKYVPKYCSSRCAALATVNKRKKRKPRNSKPKQKTPIPEKRAITLQQLQNFPIDFEAASGGKFAKTLEQILNGEMALIGTG